MNSVNPINPINPLKSLEKMTPLTSFNKNGKEHSNLLAAKMDQLGHYLTKPVSKILANAVRIGLPLQPGCVLQQKNTLSELSLRVKLIFELIILIPLALLVGGVGVLLRCLASLAKKDFVHQKGSLASQQNADSNDQIKVAVFNALLMPDFITWRNRQTPALERAQDIANAIESLDSDVVCLQEAFHTEACEVIGRELHKKGFHIIRNVGHKLKGLNSGLALISKRPLEDIQFFKHPPLSSPVDAMANKGVLLAKVKIGNKNVVIANTHFNGGGPSNLPGFLCRSAHTIAVHAHIDKYIKEQLTNGVEIDGVLLCGDTNIAPTEFERDNDVTKPEPEPEWLIAHYLQEWLETDEAFKKLIPTKDVDKMEAWEEFRKEVIKRYHAIIEPEYNTLFNEESNKIPAQDPERQKKALKNVINKVGREGKGGPFFPRLYKHDMSRDGCSEDALRGSTLNLERAHKRTQAQRVDFITVRVNEFLNRQQFQVKGRTFKVPTLNRVTVCPMEKLGKPLSDHHAVRAEIQL